MSKDLETFYEELDKTELKSVWEEAIKENIKRKNIVKAVIGTIDGLALLICMVIFVVFKFRDYYFFMIFFIIFFLFIVDFIIYVIIALAFSKKHIEYNNVFKEKIIEKLLNNFFYDIDYIPKKEMPEDTYEEGNYPGYYNRYYSDDYVDAMIDNRYSMKMAEIKTQYVETKTDSKGNTHTTTTTIFNGLFSKIHITKSINNEIRISRNGSGKGRNKLEMDSQEFEDYFDVNSTNQIVGMQILTHDIMDLLIDFRKVFKEPFDILIRDNIMYIRLHIGVMFEGCINKDEIIDKNLLKKYYNALDFINTLSKQMIKVVEDAQI